MVLWCQMQTAHEPWLVSWVLVFCSIQLQEVLLVSKLLLFRNLVQELQFWSFLLFSEHMPIKDHCYYYRNLQDLQRKSSRQKLGHWLQAADLAMCSWLWDQKNHTPVMQVESDNGTSLVRKSILKSAYSHMNTHTS